MLKNSTIYYSFNTVLSIFILCLNVASCGQIDNSQSNSPLSIQLKINERIDKSLFFNEINILPIDQKNEAFLKNILKIEVWNDNYYLLDRGDNSVKVFNKEGEFLEKIANPGDGPNTINLVYDFALNKVTNSIELMSPKGTIVSYDPKIKEYSEIISTKELLPSINYFHCINNDTIVFYSKYADHRLNYYSRKSKKIVLSELPNMFLNSANMIHLSPFIADRNDLMFVDYYAGEIYNLTTTGLKLKETVIYGKEKISGISFPDDISNPDALVKYLKANTIAYPIINYTSSPSSESFLIVLDGTDFQIITCEKNTNICSKVGNRFNKSFIPFATRYDEKIVGIVFDVEDIDGIFGELLSFTEKEKISTLTENPFIITYKPTFNNIN